MQEEQFWLHIPTRALAVECDLQLLQYITS